MKNGKTLLAVALLLLAAGVVFAQSGGNATWPDNDFTRQITKPDWNGLYKTSLISGMMFSANYRGITYQQAKDYAAALQKAGFNSGIKESDNVDSANNRQYKFSADNATGYRVGITYASTNSEVLLVVSKK